MTFEEILNMSPYSLDVQAKDELLTSRLAELTRIHRNNCPDYKKMIKAVGFNIDDIRSYMDIPFLPVRLFKKLELKSIADEDVVKTMTSSGTTGQAVSKIYLDKSTSANQQKAMVKIVSDFAGTGRIPMIIIDCPSAVKNRTMFSARGAGILGFSVFGSKKIYALDDDMRLDVDGLTAFMERHKGERILLFGFTFMIWEHFYKELLRLRAEGTAFDFSKGVLIHGGGWKKLVSEAVGHDEFHERLEEVCGLRNIHDYYGMVEQTGCIYMECEHGHLHASIFSDVIIRRAIDFSIAEIGETGIIQVVSTIPESYPGHSLLTEDEGVIEGIDDCPCGRKGKYFRVIGRLKDAEIRGVQRHVCHKVWIRSVFLVGTADTVRQMPDIPAKEPFADDILEFINRVSRALMEDPRSKNYSDVVTLGFWLRKGSMLKLKARFDKHDTNIHMGRGIAFHIAPSNVPVNFAYSLFAGLLTGNGNIIRVPSKDFGQIEIIADSINTVLDKFVDLKPYIALVRYDRDRDVNDYLSSIADTRIIWGGDATIEDVRKSPLLARSTEIAFADRYSIAVIDSDAYMKRHDRTAVAFDFYNDTYFTDQNACTSPGIVIWIGSRKNEAKKVFWNELHKLVEKKYGFQPIQGVNKLTSSYLSVVTIAGAKIVEHDDNLVIRVEVSAITENLMDWRDNGGFFFEYDCDDILELKPLCDDKRCQTIGLLGDAERVMPLLISGIRGVDRVMPVGRTMDFDLI